MNVRPHKVLPEMVDVIREKFPMWLQERGGIVVYENHVLDSSRLGEQVFLPARYAAEDGSLQDAPDEYRPNGGLPSMRQQKIDHIRLEEFDGDVLACLVACFAEQGPDDA